MKRYTAALLTTFIAFNTLALDDFDLYKYGDTEINIERQDFIVKLILFKNNEELKIYRDARKKLEKTRETRFIQPK